MLNEIAKKEFKFFSSLSDDDLSHFLNHCEYKDVPAGDILWSEGDSNNYAAFVLRGLIGIKKQTDFEGRKVIVGTYGTGSVVGELCLLTNDLRSVTAQVLEPAKLLILSSENFEKMIADHPMLGLILLKNIFLTTCKRLSKSYDRIASIF